jgi:hypothetical protein
LWSDWRIFQNTCGNEEQNNLTAEALRLQRNLFFYFSGGIQNEKNTQRSLRLCGE